MPISWYRTHTSEIGCACWRYYGNGYQQELQGWHSSPSTSNYVNN
jgi:hypothetical protein